MKFLLCLALLFLSVFADTNGCFVDENSQKIVYANGSESRSLSLKARIYKNQKCGFDDGHFYVANLNNEVMQVDEGINFLFAMQNVGCKVSNIIAKGAKIYAVCGMASVVSIAVFDKSSKSLLVKEFSDLYKISNFLLLGDEIFFTSFNGKAFLLDSKLDVKEQKSVGFAPMSACKFSDDEILLGFRNGEILDLKSGAKKELLRSKISALACAGDEIFAGDEGGVVYKFDKSFKLKGKKELFSGEIKEIFIDKNVLIGVNLDNEIKSLEINSF